MRGEASITADRTARDSFAPRLREAGIDTWRIGCELFTITNALDADIHLERALTDPSRPTQDKITLLRAILPDVHEVTFDIMSDLAGRTFSKVAHIANAVEDFAVDAMMYYADATNCTLQVATELAELHSAMINMPVVRSSVSDQKASPESRVALIDTLLEGNTLTKVTTKLARQAAYNPRRRRYLVTLHWLIGKLSRHMGESMVTVTTAKPLTDTQIERLAKVYSAKVGRPVHVNSVVDSTVIGGMRIEIGDEVTDNTVVAQLEQLKRRMSVGV